MFSLLEKQDNNTNNDPGNTVILRHDFQNDKFTRMHAEMSVGRHRCAAVVINNNNSRQQRDQVDQILVFGGGIGATTTDVVESCAIVNNNLNQQHQQWRQLGRRMPMKLCGLAAVNITDANHDDKVFLFGGSNDFRSTQDRCYEYDVTTKSYKNMPSMKDERNNFASVAMKNKNLFAIGGVDENYHVLDTVEYFDTTSATNNEEWHVLKAEMNKEREMCCSASVGEIFYVIGGYGKNDITLDCIEMYDTSKQNSKFVLLDAKMKTARAGASAVVLGYHILIIGGRDENYNVLNSIEIFNTKTQEFVDSSNYAFPTMTLPRRYFAAVLVDNEDGDNNNIDALGMDTSSKKLVVIGGQNLPYPDGNVSRTAETIDIKTTAIPISKFVFTKSNCGDEHDDGKLPPDINQKILSFLIPENQTKIIHKDDTIQKKRKRSN